MARSCQLSLLFLLIPCALYGQDTLRFSLQEAIDYAIKNKSQTKNAYLDIQVSRGQIRETLGQGFPQVNLKANFFDNVAIKSFFAQGAASLEPNLSSYSSELQEFGSDIFNQFLGLSPSLPRYNLEASLKLDQLVFDGRYFIGLQAAKTVEKLSQQQYEMSKIQMAASVAKAYYTSLISSKLIDLERQNYLRLDTLLKQTQAMYQNGFTEQIDVDRIKVAYNNAKNQFDLAQQTWYVSKQVLKYQIGVSLKTKIAATDELLVEYLPEQLTKNLSEFDFDNRVEYDIINQQIILQGYNIKQLKVGYLPTLYASVEYGYNSLSATFSELGTWANYFNYGLRFNLNIFDGLSKRSKILQEKLNLEKINNQKEDLERAILVEQLQAKSTLLKSINTLNIQRENRALAQRVYQVSKTKYQQGVGSNREVIEAETAYKEAETNFYRAIFSALNANIDYQLATGSILNKPE